jgi:uncharacterized protein (DUF58 family)
VWLEDSFGLCRSVRVSIAGTRVTVTPRTCKVHGAKTLLERGIGARIAKKASRLPTEGSFHLREYRDGDDVRRIHWVRSLVAREIVVRLPDEVPPDRPRVRLVLDTFFPEALGLTTDVLEDLLDEVVRTWLAVGQSLVQSGVRVTLVTPLLDDDAVRMSRLELSPRTTAAALRLGARAAWQNTAPVTDVLGDEATYIVSPRVSVELPETSEARWIIVTPYPVERPRVPDSHDNPAVYPFPLGVSDNRWFSRRRLAHSVTRALGDYGSALHTMRKSITRPARGFVVLPPLEAGGPLRVEAVT